MGGRGLGGFDSLLAEMMDQLIKGWVKEGLMNGAGEEGSCGGEGRKGGGREARGVVGGSRWGGGREGGMGADSIWMRGRGERRGPGGGRVTRCMGRQ